MRSPEYRQKSASFLERSVNISKDRPEIRNFVDFAAGGAGCDTVYMKKFPSDWGTSMFYYQLNSNTDDFCLKVPLDNASDAEIAKSQAKCATPCTGKVSGNDYAACAD